MRIENFFELEICSIMTDRSAIRGYGYVPLLLYKDILNTVKSNSIEMATKMAQSQVNLRRYDLLAVNREVNHVNQTELKEEDFIS